MHIVFLSIAVVPLITATPSSFEHCSFHLLRISHANLTDHLQMKENLLLQICTLACNFVVIRNLDQLNTMGLMGLCAKALCQHSLVAHNYSQTAMMTDEHALKESTLWDREKSRNLKCTTTQIQIQDREVQ